MMFYNIDQLVKCMQRRMIFIMNHDQIFRLIHWAFDTFKLSVNQLCKPSVSLSHIDLLKFEVFVSLRSTFI